MFVSVTKIHNPKSENNGKWEVHVETTEGKLETVFMSDRKKDCVEYAKRICEKPYISNGIEYGCRF